MTDDTAPIYEVVTGRYGRYMVNTMDTYLGQSLLMYGEYCQGEVDLLLQLLPDGGVALDIGANAGYLTLPLAQKVGPSGRVYAFEPQLQNFQALNATLLLNDLLNVQALQIALGQTNGKIHTPVFTPERMRTIARDGDVLNTGGISLETAQDGSSGLEVPLKRLDDLNFTRVDLIKIDVEGMELDVLRGAEQTIARHQPLIFVENNQPDRSDALISHLITLGYLCFWHLCPLFSADNFRGESENIFSDTAALNMLCVPYTESHRFKNFRAAEVGARHPFRK